MAFDSDVTVKSSGTGEVHGARARLKGFVISPGGASGSVVFKDGATTKFTVNVVANTSDVAMNIPEQGVLFKTNINVTCTNTTVTAFYTGA